jgi:DNA polymerase-3 subunit gamma/tau
VELAQGEGAPSLREQAEIARRSEVDRIRNAPLVQAALTAFPGAELIEDDTPPSANRGDKNWSRRA